MKTPSWLRASADDIDELPPPVPPIATLPTTNPLPEFSAEDEDKMVFGRAAVMLEQLKRDRADALQREQNLQAELAESVLARAGDQKKIQLLELDIAQLLNDKQTLQTDLLEKDRCLSLLRQVLDKFGTKAPPKKERKPKPKKKADRESTDPAPQADG